MSQVEVDDMVVEPNFAQANAFSAEPVAVLDFMNISVDAPVVKKSVYNLVSTENAKAWSNYPGIEIMRERKMRIDSFFDPPKIIFAPDFL